MTDPTRTRRRFRPTPAWLIVGSLVVEGLLWLSERYTWFWFNEKKGWTVLIAVAAVGVAMLVMLLWFIASLVCRWRFQFSIRSLLVLVLAVAIPCTKRSPTPTSSSMQFNWPRNSSSTTTPSCLNRSRKSRFRNLDSVRSSFTILQRTSR
jgi:hypothetical protein